MDFLNQAIAQISDLFRSMTPGARITAGLLLAVVVISVGYLFQYPSAGPDEYLFGGAFIPDGQLNQIEAAMAQAGLNAHRREGNRILVPVGLRAEYIAAVADAGALPPNFHNFLENALSQGGPWESAEATRERLKIARQQMLGEIIRHMPWVEDAVVLYDEQQPRGIRRQKVVTASVSIRPLAGEALDPSRKITVQKLVAHAVVGMTVDNVVVTSLGAENSYGADGVFPETFAEGYWQTRVAYEQYKKNCILNALRDIPGVRVEVSAELDNTVGETVQNLRPDKQGTALRTLTVEEKSTQGTSGGGGPVGVTAQGPNRVGTLPQLTQRETSEMTKTTDEADNLVGQETSVLQRTGFTPKEDWATVTIPRSYVEQIWKQRNPDAKDAPKDEDLRLVQTNLITQVEDIVLPLLTRQAKGQDEYKQVRVAIVDSLPMPAIAPPSFADTALAWTNRYWSTLAMIGVAMFSLMVLKSVVKGGPAGSSPLAAATPTLTIHSDEAPGAAAGSTAGEAGASVDENGRPKLRIKKGVSLKDDLADMVREDPDAAAAILKAWIGKAG
jgi:flagellar M-ring protein FliF